jgi:hypothetical protein
MLENCEDEPTDGVWCGDRCQNSVSGCDVGGSWIRSWERANSLWEKIDDKRTLWTSLNLLPLPFILFFFSVL